VTSSISIITPSLNQASYLERTIQSISRQNCGSVEHWVIDGGSNDATIDILKRSSTLVRWVSEPDGGQADALNKGFRLSQGNVLGWLNADDFYHPKTLNIVLQHFQADDDLMLLYGKAHHVDESGEFLEYYPTFDFELERLAFDCFICQPACFFRRELLETAGFINDRLMYAMDLDLWIRFGKLRQQRPRWKFLYIPDVLASSRMHRGNKTLSHRSQSLEEIIDVVHRHFNIVPYNWVYDLEESRDGSHDGYFTRSPFRFSLLAKSIFRWAWINREHPPYLARTLAEYLGSPKKSAQRLARRTRERF
jgi:glycosyltransferase involved in cell wall biosynthesis